MLGTQTVATLIAVYGLFMTPLGWKLAGFVWAYALVWAVVTDRVKLVGYHFLDHAKAEPESEARANQPKLDAKAGALNPEVKAEAKSDVRVDEPKSAAKAEQQKSATTGRTTPDVKADAPKPEIKAEAKPDAKAEDKPDDKAERQSDAKPKVPSDLNAQIATRAYEIYKQRGDKDSPAIADWEQAERDIRKDDANADPEAQAKIRPEIRRNPRLALKLKPGLIRTSNRLTLRLLPKTNPNLKQRTKYRQK